MSRYPWISSPPRIRPLQGSVAATGSCRSCYKYRARLLRIDTTAWGTIPSTPGRPTKRNSFETHSKPCFTVASSEDLPASLATSSRYNTSPSPRILIARRSAQQRGTHTKRGERAGSVSGSLCESGSELPRGARLSYQFPPLWRAACSEHCWWCLD